jgi:hypothetical protein
MTLFNPGHNPPQVTMPARVVFGSKKSPGARASGLEERLLSRRRLGVLDDVLLRDPRLVVKGVIRR